MMVAAILFVTLATVYDLRRREVPDWISVSLVACAAASIAAGFVELTWMQFGCGAALALAITLPLYLTGGFGGGDLKLVVALGAALGPSALLSTLLWVAICGGLLACVAWLRGRRDLAYVPAIALGLLIQWIHLELVQHATAS